MVYYDNKIDTWSLEITKDKGLNLIFADYLMVCKHSEIVTFYSYLVVLLA